MSHRNQALLVAISWASQPVAKENKGLFSSPSTKPRRAPFPSSHGLIQTENGQRHVTSLFLSPDFISDLFKRGYLGHPSEDVAPAPPPMAPSSSGGRCSSSVRSLKSRAVSLTEVNDNDRCHHLSVEHFPTCPAPPYLLPHLVTTAW